MPRNECKPLLDACRLNIYSRNAFRLLGADVDQPGRRIKRQEKELQAALGVDDLADEYCDTLRPNPLPTREDLSQAAMVLADAQQRFISEFFWFWPLKWGKSASDEVLDLLKGGNAIAARKRWMQIATEDGEASLVAKHNLAVLGHLLALDRELKVLASTDTEKLTREQRQKIEDYWNFAFEYWEALCEDESFWSMQAERIRSLDDPRLTTGFLRRFAQTLPIAFDNINADLAVEYCKREMYDSARDHVRTMRATNVGSDDVDASLRRVTEPLQRRIEQAVETAMYQLSHNKAEGKQRSLELFETIRDMLNVHQALLGEESPEYTETCDRVAATIRGCMIDYGNETKDLTGCLPLLEHAVYLAFDEDLQSRIRNDITQIKEIHTEEKEVEELKKAVTADYVYEVTISPRDDGTLRASVPGVCTCCLGTPNGEQVVSHEWEETRGLKRYKRSISFGFPICDACRNHQSEYASKQIALVLLAAGISIAIAFFARGMIQDLEWLPFVICGGLLTAVLLFMLSAVIRVGVLSEKHACRGRAVMVRDASGSCAIFRFHNPIYADSFAKANALAVRQHQEYKPTRGSFILVLPDAVLLVIAALVLGCIGQSIVYANRDGGKSSSGNSPRSLKSSPTQTDSPPKRLPPTNRHIRSPSPAPRTYTPPKRYVPTRIDTGLSKKIDSGKARLRSLEAEIAPMDSEIESMFAELGVCKRELEGYESRIRRGLRVDSDLYQRVRNKHNGLVKQYNALLVPRNFKFNEYQRERDAVNALVRQYNSGER